MHLQGVQMPEALLRVLRGRTHVRARVCVPIVPEQRSFSGPEEGGGGDHSRAESDRV